MTLKARLRRSGVLIRVMDLPDSVHGICFHDDDLTPFIVLNARMDRKHQLSALLHELEHIERGQMYDVNYNEYPEEV